METFNIKYTTHKLNIQYLIYSDDYQDVYKYDIDYIVDDINIDCNKSVNSISDLPNNVKTLTIYNKKHINENIELPYLELDGLLYSYVNIINFDTLSSSLIFLRCENSNIKKLPNTLINLETLICSNNEIEDIPETYTKLTKLIANNNKLTKISNTFKLTWLECKGNNILYLSYNFMKNFGYEYWFYNTLKFDILEKDYYKNYNYIDDRPKSKEKIVYHDKYKKYEYIMKEYDLTLETKNVRNVKTLREITFNIVKDKNLMDEYDICERCNKYSLKSKINNIRFYSYECINDVIIFDENGESITEYYYNSYPYISCC